MQGKGLIRRSRQPMTPLANFLGSPIRASAPPRLLGHANGRKLEFLPKPGMLCLAEAFG